MRTQQLDSLKSWSIGPEELEADPRPLPLGSYNPVNSAFDRKEHHNRTMWLVES